ncbi:MAG: hypothetical protein LAT68_11085 [Cyclobacteriaceae bacterium]|nr:hypothetical protein [Cyclobacteriaceae bacterium]MCH8516859.1 hypothetical protein [Cyclobacteriaceae bacterium]
MKKLSYYFIALSLLVFTACNDDDEGVLNGNEGDFASGIFVANEGNFGQANGSISFIGNDGTKRNNLFESINDRPLGDVVQSVSFDESLGYIVVNNSNRVELVNGIDLLSVGTIEAQLPRFVAHSNDHAYVSEWVGFGESGVISRIDAESQTTTASVTVGDLPEEITYNNGNLWVAHSSGDFISKINESAFSTAENFEVGNNPASLSVIGNEVVALARGNASWTENYSPGKLVWLNATSGEITKTIELPAENDTNPSKMRYHAGESNFYISFEGSIFTLSFSADTWDEAEELITTNFSNFELDADNNRLILSDAKDFSSAGEIKIFDLEGNLTTSFNVGIIPGNVFVR